MSLDVGGGLFKVDEKAKPLSYEDVEFGNLTDISDIKLISYRSPIINEEVLYAYSISNEARQFRVIRVNDTLGESGRQMSYAPGNLESCYYVLQSNNYIMDQEYLMVICFAGNSELQSKPVIWGHLLRVTFEIVVWQGKVDLTDCLAGVSEELI